MRPPRRSGPAVVTSPIDEGPTLDSRWYYRLYSAHEEGDLGSRR